eukprot:jgi/Mesen1/2955/ME000176S01995
MVAIACRQIALVLMTVLALVRVARDGFHPAGVKLANFTQLPNLVGGAVYCYMCHHSLPGIIAPMKEKEKEVKLAAYTFTLVCAFYLLLFLSTAAAFGSDQPLTREWRRAQYGALGYFIALFPVLSVSSNFPMLCITLRNNLFSLARLCLNKRKAKVARSAGGERQPLMERQLSEGAPPSAGFSMPAYVAIAMVASVPPLYFGININSLVGFTGNYAGCAVMFIVPSCFVLLSREKTNGAIPGGPQHAAYGHPRNKLASPFQGPAWPIAVLVWSFLVIAVVSTNYVYTLVT